VKKKTQAVQRGKPKGKKPTATEEIFELTIQNNILYKSVKRRARSGRAKIGLGGDWGEEEIQQKRAHPPTVIARRRAPIPSGEGDIVP